MPHGLTLTLQIRNFSKVTRFHRISLPMISDGKPRSKCERLSLTCNICRSRHQKCNGARPLCYSCQLRGLSCSYPEVPDGEQPAPRQRRVASDEKQYPLSIGRGKQRAVSVNDSQEAYGAARDILASGLVRFVLENLRAGICLTPPVGQQWRPLRED